MVVSPVYILMLWLICRQTDYKSRTMQHLILHRSITFIKLVLKWKKNMCIVFKHRSVQTYYSNAQAKFYVNFPCNLNTHSGDGIKEFMRMYQFVREIGLILRYSILFNVILIKFPSNTHTLAFLLVLEIVLDRISQWMRCIGSILRKFKLEFDWRGNVVAFPNVLYGFKNNLSLKLKDV